MITFLSAFVLLVVGYIVYGSIVDRIFGSDPKRKTPCYTCADSVDYIPMPTWKVFLIQFLNIAGTGPIFGAILGMLYGPAAYLWIVLGCIFGGAVHDYMSGMISLRKNGASLPEIIGDELGSNARFVMRVFTIILMLLVGAVFGITPAGLLSSITSSTGNDAGLIASVTGNWGWFGSKDFWILAIFIYYILATLLPIDKLIGKIYPIFGVALLVMGVGVFWGVLTQPGSMPEITEAFTNHHPAGNSAVPIFPCLFITIACGAVSGFHATQSPMMARCMKNEKLGRPVFYGAMITEGLVALIWAAASIKFADMLNTEGATPYEKLLNFMKAGDGTPAGVVEAICNQWLGTAGAILAILGVVFAPITSGDTAFRSARLITSDIFHIKQNTILKRLAVSLPIFALGATVMYTDFEILWRYFAWSNQTLSVFTLWAITVWLAKQNKNYFVSLVPAIWMTVVCSTYILIAPEGFMLTPALAYTLGCAIGMLLLVMFVCKIRKIRNA